MGAVLVAILVHHPPQHLSSAVVVEVGIDIGQVDTVGIQETLKQEVILQGVYLGDAQTVGHHGAGRRATPRPHPHAEFPACSIDEVLHDEEVAGETHGLHHVKLKVDMLPHVVGNGVAIEPARAVVGEFGQIVGLELDAVDLVVAAQAVNHGLSLFGVEGMLAVLIGGELLVELLLGELLPPLLLRAEAFGNGEEGHDGSVVNAVDLHLVEDLQGVGQCLWHVAEHLVHLRPGLEPLLLAVAHAVGVVEVLARGQTEQVVVGLGRLLVLEVHVVGADDLDAILLGQLQQHTVGLLLQGKGLTVGQDCGVLHLVTLQLQVVVVAKHAMIPLAGLAGSRNVVVDDLGGHLACDTGRANDEVLVVFLQVGAVGARTVVVAVDPSARDELDEILVAVVVLGQHDEVIAGVVAILLHLVFLAVTGDIHLAAENGLEGLLPVFLPAFVDLGTIIRKFLDAEHHAVVGDGHATHTVVDGLVYDVGNARLAIKDGVVGVYV